MKRRIRIYLTGVGMGLILVYVLLIRQGDRDIWFWLPQDKVAFAIQDDSILVHSPSFQCFYTCSGLDSSGLASFLRESDFEIVRKDPFEYQFTDNDANGVKLKMKFRQIKYNRYAWLYLAKNEEACDCPKE